MNKKKISIIVSVAILIITIISSFWLLWKKQAIFINNQRISQTVEIEGFATNEKNNQQNSEILSVDKIEDISNVEIPAGWNLYQNEDFGIKMRYPKDRYIISEESGMVHFYYTDGTANPGSQQRNYINININKVKKPPGIEALDELLQYFKENSAEVKRISKETEIKRVGKTRFIVIKYYNNDSFFSVLFTALGKEESYRISFGGYWNIIEDNQFEIIMKMMESFEIIR